MSLNEVIVVKYDNPHLFWIREQEDVNNLERIEKCLKKELKRAIRTSAEANDLVALQDVDGFKRAIVVDVNNGYNCWLLDYGRFLFTQDVYNLSESLSAVLPMIKVAALDNIVAIRHKLNVETNKDEVEVSPHFDLHTIRFVEDKLSQAKQVYFYNERRIGDIFCGTFILVTDDRKLNLADVLIEEGLAVMNKELFLEALAESCPKIPIIASYKNDNMSDNSNVCLIEGIGRGRSRTKAASDKNRQIDAWLKEVNETSSNVTDIEDNSTREQDILSSLSDLSESNVSEASQMVVSENSTSMNTSFSETSKKSSANLSATKLRGRGKLLINEIYNSVNKGNVEIVNQGIVKDGTAKDLNLSADSNSSVKKCLRSSDILKLVHNFNVKSDQSTPVKSEEKPSSSTGSSDTSTSNSSSIISRGNKSLNDQTNFSGKSSDKSSVASEKPSVKVENFDNTLKGVIMTNSFPCKCESCKKVLDDDFDETPKIFTDEVIKVNEQFCVEKPQPLIKTDLSKSDTLMIKKRDKNQTKIEKDMAPNLLIHSPGHLPTPTSDLSKVPFCVPVHNALRSMKYKVPRSMQMYMWPALMRSMNACIINAQSSGKTMCYLPALCSFLIQKEGRYPFLPKEPSPIAVILCDSIKRAEEIFDLLRTFLSHTCKKVDIALLVPPIEEQLLKFLKRSEIIVSTPNMFIRILSSRMINLKRLCHLIIEDADKMLNQTGKELYRIVKAAQSMLDHRAFVNSVQIVMTSEKWTIALEDFIRHLEAPPVICIGSHLESVIYAKANIEMHFVKKEEKTKRITTVLKEYSKDLKTIIICNSDDEVLEVADYFQILGVSVIAVTRSMMREEIEEKEVLWLSTPLKNNSVFICTDYMLHAQLSITTAQILIHYSLPTDSWSMFTRRFKCVIDTHDSPFNAKFNRANAVKVHIFVDESCSKQFPRLYYFLQQMKTTLPSHFKSFCEKLEKADELVKIEKKEHICKRLKLLGKCSKFRCKKRHLFSQSIDAGEDVPSSGIIKFKVLHVFDVTQFGIKVLKHWSTDRKEKNLIEYNDLVTEKLQSCMGAKRLLVIDVKVGSLYVYFDAKEVSFHRCKILKILSRQQITDAANEVKIKLIDNGVEKTVFASLLFELPPEYLEIPPQSIEARLANVVPLEHDTEWNVRTKCKVEKMLNDLIENYPNAYFVGQIVLQVGGTVWLEDLIMREDVVASKETVTLLTLKRKLTTLDLVDINQSPLNSLRHLCMKSGLDLPNYDMEPIPKPKVEKISQVKPQWAYLATQPDVYNVVYFSHAQSPEKFYVKLEKYYDLYMDLEEEIQTALEKPHYPTIEEVVPGNCYLAKDPGGDNYNRVLAKNIKEDSVECFFVDFGDTVDIPLDELKYLSNEHISKLPFQAIECELYGIKSITETWPTEAVNVFYKFCYRPDTDIYRDLFVNVVNYDCAQKKYSVAMLDCYEDKKVVINQILIDCGLAIDNETAKLEDLVLPELNFESDEENDYNANNDDEKIAVPNDMDLKEIVQCLPNRCELPENFEEMMEDIDRNAVENGGWDFAIWDFQTFMKELLMEKRTEVTQQSSSQNYFIPMKAAPSTSHYTPNILWHQTKLHVVMEIQLHHVQNYSAIVLRKKMFLFSTKLDDKEYILNFALFDNVSHVEKLNTGLHVKVTLTKVTEEEWPRLVSSKEKMRNIKYDLTKIEDEEPKKRRFLDHGFGPDEDDEDYPTIHNISSEEDEDSDSDSDDMQ